MRVVESVKAAPTSTPRSPAKSSPPRRRSKPARIGNQDASAAGCSRSNRQSATFPDCSNAAAYQKLVERKRTDGVSVRGKASGTPLLRQRACLTPNPYHLSRIKSLLSPYRRRLSAMHGASALAASRNVRQIPPALKTANCATCRTAAGDGGGALCRTRVAGRLLSSFIGAGVYEHHIPAAIWQSSRAASSIRPTPLPAEASQGTLQLSNEYPDHDDPATARRSNRRLRRRLGAGRGGAICALAQDLAPRAGAEEGAPDSKPAARSTRRQEPGIELVELDYTPPPARPAAADSGRFAGLAIPHPNFFACWKTWHALTDGRTPRGAGDRAGQPDHAGGAESARPMGRRGPTSRWAKASRWARRGFGRPYFASWPAARISCGRCRAIVGGRRSGGKQVSR